ncbi:MAG: class I SAM-dependent RNA methyltransferase [Candidatus Cyclonatronum sp.]|uniref:THUMP domain-containing class I SAM-dependent RNA methyltransferase n=1 Tax=Cyclonatronum sp. TaxID=3024185 RepID=UPI0025BB2262|nr:class I SAM-dependent RNA methyltransferase [Cyclonatronum sp.]MCH8486541.1 class I SAM-dependent RNA methyltransferase [Cyclonatronum sp.]
MSLFQKESVITLSCPRKLAPYLKTETEALNFKTLAFRETGLDVRGTLNDCIRLNLQLRTSHRVHYLLSETKADTPDALYQWLTGLPWESWIPRNGYVAVTSRVSHPTITNTQFANLKVKDAVVDRIRAKTGLRPDAGSETNKTVLFLFWDEQQARIFFDTSGESLSRRGYRVANTEAPMQESLAAALVMASGWKPGTHFINPMCGSGTLAIEAAMHAAGIEPAARRRNFGFMHINGFERAEYKKQRLSLRSGRTEAIAGQIIATDHAADTLEAARQNAKAAGVEDLITFVCCDYSETPLPEGEGVIVMNPPYGERLGIRHKLAETYTEIGSWMKHKAKGKTGFVITSDPGLAKRIGLKPAVNQVFFNTTLECRFLGYELY